MKLLAPKHQGAAARRLSRDPQQEKVYTAETAAGMHASRQFVDIKECAEWIGAAFTTGLIEEQWPTVKTFKYKDNQPGVVVIRQRRRSGKGVIAHATLTTLAFTKEGMKTWVAVHEMAHLIARRVFGKIGDGHGWRFCEVYLKLTGWFIGYKEQAMLQEEFDKQGIHYTLEQATPPWLWRKVGGRG